MKTAQSLIGKRFGRLLVTEERPRDAHGKLRWLVTCDCGGAKIVTGDALRNGRTQSCGCIQKERARETATKHGLHRHSAYVTWRAMMQRCYNPKHEAYPEYGGRGIEVCARWHDVANFIADVGERPDNASIDRIENDKGYEPGNWRWSNPVEQANNTRQNVMLTHNGKTQTAAQWAREIGISAAALHNRLHKLNWSVEKALTTPITK